MLRVFLPDLSMLEFGSVAERSDRQKRRFCGRMLVLSVLQLSLSSVTLHNLVVVPEKIKSKSQMIELPLDLWFKLVDKKYHNLTTYERRSFGFA